MVEIHGIRKTFPTNRENGGPVKHSSERPPVIRIILGDLGSNVMAAGSLTSQEITLPLLSPRIISRGGGRSIGGGTSTKSLRNARLNLERFNRSG